MKSIDRVNGIKPVGDTQLDPIQLIESQARAGYAAEDITMIIESMASDAIEPT